MPDLLHFRNFFYKEGKRDFEKLKLLVAPPYDVISEEEKKDYKNRHPDNICHVILPETYEAAGKKLDQMIEDGTLIHERDRCICIYGIDYVRPDTGEKISRYGFVGLLKLVEIFPAQDGVIPHEMTFRKYTKDRYNLIKETDANFSPIFTVYNGNGAADKLFEKYTKKKPILKTTDRDGFTHKIWEVWKEEDIQKFQDIVKNHSIIIADGHHRYTTSLRYSRHGGCKYIMSLFIDFNDPGLIIYTSHRQIHTSPAESIEDLKKRVAEKFNPILETVKIDKFKLVMKKNKENHVFGCYFQKKFIIFKLKPSITPEEEIEGNHSKEWKNLNLPILHDILLDNCLGIGKEDIDFIKGVRNGVTNVDQNESIKALFMVNPTTLEEVHRITQLGEIMPQKSTYFYPKPLSGLVIHKHTDKIE
ncbi:MAG: DUF1015 domain-containing protein [Promethearchaeia archaeon]